jgi:hypothetical protein
MNCRRLCLLGLWLIACSPQSIPPGGDSGPDDTDSDIEVHAESPFVGIGYQTWFPPQDWSRSWDEPELGYPQSGESRVIDAHAEWLVEAGVDFILID